MAASESTPLTEGAISQSSRNLCYHTKLVPFTRSDGKVYGTGSGAYTVVVNPENLTYTRTIVFSDLSNPTDESYVHEKLMKLTNFPINVYSGAYTQTFVGDSFQANYFYNQKARPADIYIFFNQFDILHGRESSPCEEIASSTSASSYDISLEKNFRGTA